MTVLPWVMLFEAKSFRDIFFSSIPLKVSLDISLTFFNTTSVECLHQLTIAKKRNENTFARLQNG
uniref:Uncharacterized protein n=1 Tax=Glossina palpalis gambiensis TaxID=67801 RepID=A0A1B0BGK6_9MUSC